MVTILGFYLVNQINSVQGVNFTGRYISGFYQTEFRIMTSLIYVTLSKFEPVATLLPLPLEQGISFIFIGTAELTQTSSFFVQHVQYH